MMFISVNAEMIEAGMATAEMITARTFRMKNMVARGREHDAAGDPDPALG